MTEAEQTEAPKKRRSGRSPAYPFISVKKALEQANALLDQEGEYQAPLSSAFKAWGYGTKSSGGRQTLATLKYYGLIDVSGEGNQRKVKISEIARRILLDKREDETEKKQLIRKVALNPAAHKLIYDEYPNGLASDGSVHHFLMFEHNFKDDAASDLLSEFKETSQYAEIYQPQNEVDKNGDSGDTSGTNGGSTEFSVGDWVDWESSGQLMWKKSWKVIGIDEYETGEKFLHVEGVAGDDVGKDGWISMSEALSGTNPIESGGKAFTPPPHSPPGEQKPEGFEEERLFDDDRKEIRISFEDGPTLEQYQYLRDYYDFKIARLKKEGA